MATGLLIKNKLKTPGPSSRRNRSNRRTGNREASAETEARCFQKDEIFIYRHFHRRESIWFILISYQPHPSVNWPVSCPGLEAGGLGTGCITHGSIIKTTSSRLLHRFESNE